MSNRDQKILLAFKVTRKKFARENPLLANFYATLWTARNFGISLLAMQELVRSWKRSGKLDK